MSTILCLGFDDLKKKKTQWKLIRKQYFYGYVWYRLYVYLYSFHFVKVLWEITTYKL